MGNIKKGKIETDFPLLFAVLLYHAIIYSPPVNNQLLIKPRSTASLVN